MTCQICDPNRDVEVCVPMACGDEIWFWVGDTHLELYTEDGDGHVLNHGSVEIMHCPYCGQKLPAKDGE